MTNPEHLERLKQGVEIWNQWRRDNPEVIPDLNEVDLEEADLSRANLSRANLSGADLGGANLTWADLSWADLSWANLRKADLGWANISGANLYEANLSKAELHNADLSWANINETDLGESDTKETIFGGKDLSGVDLSGVDLSGRALSGANLSGAKLCEANLYKVILSEANLSGANLQGANLREANLHRANLSRANLRNAILCDADLRQADLYEADLTLASFIKAYLGSANFNKSNLIGASLISADLSHANLREADLSNATLICADLTHAECCGAKLREAELGAARLFNTKLDGAILTGACLWEIQRAEWAIKDVICEYAYWDKNRQLKNVYSPGEFERLYTDKTKVRLFYKDGINPLEITTLPALIKHLEASHPGSGLRLVSIREDSGGAVVELAIEDDDKAPEQLKRLKAEIETTAQRAIEYERKFLAEEKQRLQLEGALRHSDAIIDKLILRPSINYQGNNMGDTNIVSGQAGIVGGQNAHAHDMTFNQIVNNFEKSIDLPALAKQLAELREEMAKRGDVSPQVVIAQGEAAKAEMAAKEGNTSKVVEYLKAGGQVLLDVAKETGKELLTAAIKASMGMP